MNADADLPRIALITSEAPHLQAAGAIALHRLLRGYPMSRLRVITNSPPPIGSSPLACPHAHLPLWTDRLRRTRVWRWRTILRAAGATELLPLGRIDRALAGFRTDVVVTLMQDSWYYDLAARFARQRSLPLVLFVHDVPSGFEEVPARWRTRQRHRDQRVYQQAVQRLCVSPGMERYFRETFGVDGSVLLPPKGDSTPRQEPTACGRLKAPGVLTLGYAGGLHYGYGEQLLQMIPTLRDTGTCVEVFSARPSGVVASLLDAPDVIRLNAPLPTPAAAWEAVLARCDAVLLPYRNPPGVHAAQYRTHFPSKLGDCLHLGLPLLVTGPADASGVAWCAARPGTALLVTDPGTAGLGEALRDLRANNELRIRLAQGAQNVAPAFSAAALRNQLSALLRAAAADSHAVVSAKIGTPHPTP